MLYLGPRLEDGRAVDAFARPDADIAALAEAIARLKADQLRLARGVADDFSSTDGVDLAASVSELYDGTNKRFTRTAPTAGSAKSNTMTSNTAPSPNVAASSGNDGSFQPFLVWDSNATNEWYGRAGQLDWVSRDFGAGNAFVLHSYDHRATSSYKAEAWVIEGSNDNSSWTVVDTVTGQPAGDGSPTNHVCDTITTAYRYFRCRPTTLRGGYHGLGNLVFYEASVPANLSVRSIAYTALASPANGYIRVKATALAGSITPGTNLRAWASRNDGTTWIEATLTYLGEFEGGRNYHGDIAFTGASGTAMRWRVDATTDGAASIAIDDVTLLWSE